MIIAAILLTVFIVLISVYIIQLWSRLDFFKRQNIPGPPGRLFFGHCLTLWTAPSLIRLIQNWTRQYGSIYGIFEGAQPVYVVSDVNFLQEVYIKQFSCFHSRRNNFLNEGFKSMGAHLFSANANQWRRQRHVINPTFTAMKLKLMTPLIRKCIESMVTKVDQINGKEFNIYDCYRRLTMDVIWHCAFGIDTDLQNDLDNIYLKKSLACFAIDSEKTFLVRLSKLFPYLSSFFAFFIRTFVNLNIRIFHWFPSLINGSTGFAPVWIITNVEQVVKKRLSSGEKRQDLLQLMIDAAIDEEIKDNDNDELMSKHIHYTEVVMNVFLFMLAGFETTSTFLAYSTEVLAKHPEIQEKLLDEINENFTDSNDIFDYEKIANLSYMDLFIREVLRMYRISGLPMTRECNKTTNVCGHKIEEGTIILTDVHAVHYDPELWGPEDPYLFIPERHAVKRHPVAYMPFGIGPRNCVGLRLALIELKMTLARLLFSYKVEAGDHFEEGLTRKEAFLITPNAINIRLKKRNK